MIFSSFEDRPASPPSSGASGDPPPPGGRAPGPIGPRTFRRPILNIVANRQRELEILAGIDRLPAIPIIVHDIIRLSHSPAAGASEFEKLIRQDQVLAARMLKVVNSSFYALPNRINNISLAIVVLGIKTLKSIVFAASTSHLLMQRISGYGFSEAGLWKHSFATAQFARRIAIRVRPEDQALPEEVFVGGLLHDIGKVVLAPFAAKVLDRLLEQVRAMGEGAGLAAETEAIGFHHAEVGAWITQRWKLGPEVEEMIQCHHHPRTARQFALHVAIVHLANVAANRLGIGHALRHPFTHPIEPEALERTGLTAADFDVLLEAFDEGRSELESLYTEMK